MIDFPLIATFFYAVGLKEKNIKYEINGLKQKTTALCTYENNEFKLIIIENLNTVETDERFTILLEINKNVLMFESMNNTDVFYNKLIKAFVLFLVPFKLSIQN